LHATPEGGADCTPLSRGASELRWRGAPPGMPPGLADEFMDAIKAGKTIRMGH